MKYNQSGIVHLQLIVVAVLVVGVVSFGAFRIGQVSSTRDQAKDENTDTSLAEDILIKEAEQNEAKEVEIPAEKTSVEEQAVPAPKPAPKPVEQKPTEETKKKEDKVWLQMEKVVASQEGSVLKIVSRLPSDQTGKCNYKLWQNGYEKVYSSNNINGSRDCKGQLDISNLPTYSGWELHVWFDGSDGKTHGYQKEGAVSLTNPN